MQFPFRLFAGLISALLAVAPLRAAAPHPTVLTVKYGGQMLPVAKVLKTDPIVRVDGREVRIQTEPDYRPIRTEHFGPGLVHIVHEKFNSYRGMGFRADLAPDFVDLDITLRPTMPFAGGYLMIAVFRPVHLSDRHEVVILARELPALPQGDGTKLSFRFTVPGSVPSMRHFIQLFDQEGREVLTDKVSAAWDFYADLEKQLLRDAVARYCAQFAGKDHAPFPVVQPRPLLPESAVLPPNATATLAISGAGLVTETNVEGVEDPMVLQSFADALGGWLFLPKLRAGAPIPCTVKIPLGL